VSSQDFFDHEPDDLERYLVEQGRRDGPADGVRQRATALAVATSTAGAGLATASIASGSAASAVASAAPWTIAAKWIAIGVVSGMATIGVSEGLRYERQPAPASRPAVVVPVATATVREQAKREQAKPPERTDESSAPARERSSREHPVDPSPQAMPSNPATTEASDQAALGGVAVEEPSRQAQPRKAALAQPSSDVAGRDESRALRTSRPSGAESSWSAPPPPDVPPGPPLKERVRDKSLKSELGYLEEARVALEAHAGANALRLLDEYARLFPAGSMRIEATALRVEALLVLGRRSDAQALGDSFLAHYPKSPAAMRVRLLLGSRDNTPSKP